MSTWLYGIHFDAIIHTGDVVCSCCWIRQYDCGGGSCRLVSSPFDTKAQNAGIRRTETTIHEHLALFIHSHKFSGIPRLFLFQRVLAAALSRFLPAVTYIPPATASAVLGESEPVSDVFSQV